MSKFKFDEVSLFELTPGEKRRRKEVALSGLPKVVLSTKSGIRLVNEVHEFRWQFERPFSPLSKIAISMNCVCVAQNGVVKLYDGLVDAWSETPNFMDYIDDDDDENIIMVVRRGPMWSNKDVNSKPIKMGVDVLKIVFTWENPKTLRGTFESQNSQKKEVPVLLNRIEDAFPAVVSRSGGSETNLSAQYYEVGTQKIVLNSGIFAHLIMNDPVMGFLYHIMKARNNTVIKLNRRDEKNSSVHFYQLPSGYVGIYFQAPTGKAGKNILEKIISSLMYYEEKKKEVENLYLTLGIQGQNMLSGLNIDPSTPAISIVEEIDEEDEEYEEDEEDEEEDDEIALRKTLDIATAMQNNPGISFKTLRSLSMSTMVHLNPRRWGPAAAIGNNVDLYMLSNDGLIVPHSKNGLYTRKSQSTHAVILFISEDEVFLIGKWDGPPQKKVNLDYKKIKGQNMVGCVPSAVNTVLTGHDVDSTVARYYIQSVKGGDGKVGFLKCIEFAKSNDSNFLFRKAREENAQIRVPADAVVEHLSTIFQQMTTFFSGASVPVPGSADGGQYQVVDGSGKFCGTRSSWEKADAPFPQKKVKSLRLEGVVHKFMSNEQISSFLSQICLYRFSIFLKNDNGGTIDAFALSELKEGKFEKLKSFSYNLGENFKDEKIIVPSVKNIKFELSQAMKNPQFVKNYHTATHLLGFFRKGAYHDKNFIVLPANQFSQWAMAWKKPNDTFVHKPVEQLEKGRTYFIRLQRRLARAVNHTSFQNAKEYLTNKKVLAPALIIYDGNFSENMYTQKGAIVGWKNNGKFFFTSIIFV